MLPVAGYSPPIFLAADFLRTLTCCHRLQVAHWCYSGCYSGQHVLHVHRCYSGAPLKPSTELPCAERTIRVQACRMRGSFDRRRIADPIAPKPMSINPHVLGSGTAAGDSIVARPKGAAVHRLPRLKSVASPS